jgi:hypothetical protein
MVEETVWICRIVLKDLIILIRVKTILEILRLKITLTITIIKYFIHNLPKGQTKNIEEGEALISPPKCSVESQSSGKKT